LKRRLETKLETKKTLEFQKKFQKSMKINVQKKIVLETPFNTTLHFD